MLWLVLDYSADILYGMDMLVRARTGEWARAPCPRSHSMQQWGCGGVAWGLWAGSGRSRTVALGVPLRGQSEEPGYVTHGFQSR